MSNYNFTNGTNIIGSDIHTNTSAIYDFSIDLELIHVILIIIMLCQIAQTSYIFLRFMGLIKK